MTHSYRLMLRLLVASILWVGFATILSAQTFNGEAQSYASLRLQKILSSWEVYSIDVQGVDAWLQANPSGTQTQFNLGSHQWNLDLVSSRIIAPNYNLQVETPNGIETRQSNAANKAFMGTNATGGGQVRLTVDNDFICGYVTEGDEMVFIEPLWWHDNTVSRNLFVVYNASAVNSDIGGGCMALEWQEKNQRFQNEELHDDAEGDENRMMACYEVELAIASDRSMFDKYGSVADVEDHNIAVINNVQNNYNGSFTHDITIVIVTQFVVTGTDPWTSSTDAGTLLGSFRTWGNAGGFGTSFDLGELWTDRDFSGGTIGIAWLSAVCTNLKYHCLQDFSSNAQLLRVLTAHEIGHNFSAGHDGSGCPGGFIMCPSVNTSNTWSNGSINSINNFVNQLINNGCLSSCGPPPPPLIADFTWSPDPACQGVPVMFDDNSSGNIVSRVWAFQSGTPLSSTQINPTVTWNSPGTFNVTLTLNGLGGISASITKQITIEPLPVANFTYTVAGTTVTFNNTSQNETTVEWDFGDGNFSNEDSPVHTYSDGGIYTVVLTVTNNCGTSIKTLIVNTAPTADFEASPTSGCAPLTVQFTNLSSDNATSYIWQFPGGLPNQSNLQNPTVVYPSSGTFSVTLTASNSSGSSTTIQTNFITVQNIPSANFTHSANGLVVTFTNTSVGGTSWLWNFGDGNTSTQQNPVHTYAVGGSYTVTLTTTNPCGSTVTTKTVGLIPPPTASFTATPTSGCAPLTVQFTSTATGNPSSYNWSFPGGTPTSSTEQNPSVVYNTPGTYNVTFIAFNAGGSDTLVQTNYVTVNGTPATSFTSSVNGSTASFTNTTTNGTTYSWAFGDGGTSTQSNPSHTYANDGTYTVVLTSTNACGTSTATQTVTIITPPLAAFNATPTTGCAAFTVQFNNQSSPNSTTFAWTFPGGTPSSSTLANPTVTYNTPGQYTVTLIASNSAGADTIVLNNYITVTTVPAAGFTSSTNGATVDFTNTTTGGTSYSWNFGDGGSSAQSNPSHTYTADGTYTVVLTATNACGTSTATQTVTVVLPPTAAFTATNTSGCSPLVVQFVNQSSPNTTSVSWSFPGGTPSTSTQSNPQVVYDVPGSYSVTLTATNSAGNSTATQTDIIQVSTTPDAAFSNIQNNGTVAFTNNTTGATGYTWFFGDGGTSVMSEPTYTYTADGVYTVVLVANNACGNDTATQTVTVVLPPTAAFTASDLEGCSPFTVQFNNESSDNVSSFAWAFEGGDPATSAVENPSVTWNQPGVYQVVLTVSNAAGTSTATSTITVNTLPTAGFTTTTAGLSVQTTNTSTGGSSYLWDFGDGSPTSTETSPVHDYASTGSYTIKLTVTNDCGTVEFGQDVEIVGAPPIAQFTAESTKGCSPFAVQFTDMSIGGPTSWAWTFVGGTPNVSTDQNPTVTYATPGVYTVALNVTNLFGNNTMTLVDYIVVQDLPQAGFSYQAVNDTVNFSNISLNADSYQWNFGDGGTSTEANPTYVYGASGMYTVELTAINTCGAATLQQMVEVILVATNEPEWLNSFRLYPNPNDGSFNIDMVGEPADEVAFTLYDAAGRLIKRDVSGFDSGVLRQNFRYQDLPSGMYHMHILAGDKSKHVKIVVQR